MLKYHVVAVGDSSFNDLRDFEHQVNCALSQGWALHGGVSVTHIVREEYRYAQAMTKEVPE